MRHASRIIDEQGHALKRDFGAFYPTGYSVVAFETQSDAEKVMSELQAADAVFAGCIEYSAQQMASFAELNLAEAGFIASLGTSVSTVQSFLDAARDGATFLIVPTPNNKATERAMQAVHRVPFVLAERYHRLAIEELY